MHFIRKSCWGCDGHLVKIVDDWYIEHDERQCISKNEPKQNFLFVPIKSEQLNAFDFGINEMDEMGNSNVSKCSLNDSPKNSCLDGKNPRSQSTNSKFHNNLTLSVNEESTAEADDVNDMRDKIKCTKKRHTVQCEMCAKTMLNVSLRLHMKLIHKVVSTKTSEEAIRLLHTKAICKICDRTFANHESLKKHLKHIHTDSKRYVCNHCGRKFNQAYELREHSYQHSDTKPYKCESCPRTFARPSSLKAHNRKHTGERPYKCTADQCEKAFYYMTDLKRHKFRHHGICDKENPCPYCEKILPERRFLEKHIEREHPEMNVK